jgi:hypothetical protein
MSKTKIIRNEGLDKFYTNDNIVELCINELLQFYPWNHWDLIIEPSAGNGQFLFKIPVDNKIGLDIKPDHDDIIEQDFLLYKPNEKYKNILIIGNPPFGKNSSLAIKFFNHASKWCNVIAFIIPRTFRKISVQNKLNTNFHLIHDIEIPLSPCSFTPNMSVKCCFQIWKKENFNRDKIILDKVHNDWVFLQMGEKDKNNQPTPPVNADFAIRAYGGKCGEILSEDLLNLRPKSYHWIKSNIDIDILKKNFNNIDYSISLNTARQNSIGRGELVMLYNDIMNLKI